MHHIRLFIPALLLLLSSPSLASTCLQESALKQLDHRYEQAIRSADTEFLAQLLKEEFIWVHNRAVQIESKTDLLTRLQDASYQPPKARASEEVAVRSAGSTAVLTGYTTVEQFNDDGKTTRWSRYHFMRTYILENGSCRLLAGKTVKVSNGNSAQ
jgi:ketosteroid isomerase-like protein